MKKFFFNENYPQDLKSSSRGGIGTWLKHLNTRVEEPGPVPAVSNLLW